MLTFIFVVAFIAVMWEIIGLAIKATWEITKVLFSLVFLPIGMIVLAIAGLYVLAIPILIIVGIVVLIEAIA